MGVLAFIEPGALVVVAATVMFRIGAKLSRQYRLENWKRRRLLAEMGCESLSAAMARDKNQGLGPDAPILLEARASDQCAPRVWQAGSLPRLRPVAREVRLR